MTDNKQAAIYEGEIALFTKGDYSDYCILAIAKVKKTLRVNEIESAYLAAFPDQAEYGNFEADQLLAWLVKEGYVEELDFREFNLSSCRTLEGGEIR